MNRTVATGRRNRSSPDGRLVVAGVRPESLRWGQFPATLRAQQLPEALPVRIHHIGIEDLVMRAVDLVDDDVAGNVRTPILGEERTAILVITHRGEDGHIAEENTGLVNLAALDIVSGIPEKHIEKALVSRHAFGSGFTDELVELPMRVRLVVIGGGQVRPQGFFHHVLLGQGSVGCSDAAVETGLSVEEDKACDCAPAPLQLDREFVGDDAAERPADEMVGAVGIGFLDSVGVALRHLANRPRRGVLRFGLLNSDDRAIQMIAEHLI